MIAALVVWIIAVAWVWAFVRVGTAPKTPLFVVEREQ
jgi:hypothetical protein